MKKRDVILDFTSLLDVTLIVIFFFVLFSHLDSEENKTRTDAKMQELEIAIQEAEDREEKASALGEQLENEISIVKEYSDRQGSNVSEILEFNRSENVKMILDMTSENWSVRVIKGDSVISTVVGSDNIGSDLKDVLSKAGYDNTETIFCDLVFDGSLPGTASAYRTIKRGMEDVSKDYRYFYSSETDLSIGGE